jgi:hypothetical protein
MNAELARVKPFQEALERKDLASLQALGFDFATLAREAMEANTPEGIARRTQAELDKIKADQKKRLDDAAEQQRRQQTIEATRRDAQLIVQVVESDPHACPELYAWSPERVADEGIKIRDAFFRRDKRWPNAGMIIAVLEKRARDEAAVQQTRTTALQQQRSANTRDAGSAGKADPNRTSVGGKPPALTGSTANERPPSPPRQKTEAEIDAECLAELAALRKR